MAMDQFQYLRVEQTPSDEYLRLLDKNVIGTPGESVVYQQKNSRKKVLHLKNPYFIHLVKNNQLVGSCCLLRRELNNQSSPGYYLRYFTLNPWYRKPVTRIKRTNSKNRIKSEFKEILKGTQLNTRDNALFFYAYVDPHNIRSQLLCDEFTFEPVGQLSTLIFSRLFPRQRLNIQRLEEDQYSGMRDLLSDQYSSFSMVNLDNVFFEGNYFVFMDSNQEILLGAQANPEFWNILEMPGKPMTYMLKVFSRLPILNRIFNKEYRFLSIEALYIKPGHEFLLSNFLESILYHFKFYSCLLALDIDSHQYATVKNLNLGLLNRIKQETTADIIIHAQHLTQNELNFLKAAPAYISTFDLT